jgi:hypothetical protein
MMTEDAQVVQTIDFDDGGSDTVGDVSAAPVVAQGYGYNNTYGYPYPPQQYYNNNAMFYNVNNNNNNFVNTENNFDSDTAMDEDINVL